MKNAAAAEPTRSTVEWAACPESQILLDGLDRTEDVMFSPSRRRLAVAGFKSNRIGVFDITITRSGAGKKVTLSAGVEIHAATLRLPHGICFLDEETIAVANRAGNVQVFGVPASAAAGAAPAAMQTLVGSSAAKIHTPGSVAAFPVDAHHVELLVCNNYVHSVTRHLLDRRAGFAATSDELLLKAGLSVPDGICYSSDGQWIAVSNHDTHTVLLYERGAGLDAESEPAGILTDVLCPHGLRFTADQEFMIVADAAAPYLNVYQRGDRSWNGVRQPIGRYRAMGQQVFTRGRHNPQEGGPKGIDIDDEAGIVVCTCECQTLAFFDLAEVLGSDLPENRQIRYVQWRFANAMFNRFGWMPHKPPAVAAGSPAGAGSP